MDLLSLANRDNPDWMRMEAYEGLPVLPDSRDPR